jgi:hypothetical protein
MSKDPKAELWRALNCFDMALIERILKEHRNLVEEMDKESQMKPLHYASCQG